MAHNFSCIHNKSMAFPGLIFIKLAIVQWHYLQISYIEFHLSQNKCSRCELKLINNLSIKNAFSYSCFHKICTYWRHFCELFYWIRFRLKKFLDNAGQVLQPRNGGINEWRLQVDSLKCDKWFYNKIYFTPFLFLRNT
jgi:hypothetical protein